MRGGALVFSVFFVFAETGTCPVSEPETHNPLPYFPKCWDQGDDKRAHLYFSVCFPDVAEMDASTIWWGKEEKVSSMSVLGCCDGPITLDVVMSFLLVLSETSIDCLSTNKKFGASTC